jgi:dual specificity protein kinase YAK1
MMEVGKQAGEFFETGEQGARKLKSLEQYSLEHNTTERPSRKYYKGTTLPEIIHINDKGTSLGVHANEEPAERISILFFT